MAKKKSRYSDQQWSKWMNSQNGNAKSRENTPIDDDREIEELPF